MLAYTLLFFICIIKFVKLINEICEISLDIICHFFSHLYKIEILF